RDRRPGPADHGFAVANLRVDDDALIHNVRLLRPPRSFYPRPRASERATGRLTWTAPANVPRLELRPVMVPATVPIMQTAMVSRLRPRYDAAREAALARQA